MSIIQYLNTIINFIIEHTHAGSTLTCHFENKVCIRWSGARASNDAASDFLDAMCLSMSMSPSVAIADDNH